MFYYVISAQVFDHAGRVLLDEAEKVNTLEEAVKGQRDWLEWFHAEKPSGWKDLQLKIHKTW